MARNPWSAGVSPAFRTWPRLAGETPALPMLFRPQALRRERQGADIAVRSRNLQRLAVVRDFNAGQISHLENKSFAGAKTFFAGGGQRVLAGGGTVRRGRDPGF